MKLSDLVNTSNAFYIHSVPSGSIRCDSCLKTHKAQDESHSLIGVIPNFQFCPKVGKFATWTQLAVPNNFLAIPNLNLERD